MSTISITQLQAKKAANEKFAVITAYDAPFAKAASDAGIEAILVGDSLGMAWQGQDSTLPVTVDDMAYHIAAVKRGNPQSLIVGDLPFGSYMTPAQAMDNSARLMQAGAQVVKLEGGTWLLETIRMLTERGMPVCAHLGLTPQSVNLFGGYKIQGRTPEQAQRIIDEAKAVEAAGAVMLVIECVPQSLGRAISAALRIPVIGIGAGPGTDAQVLVLTDMLGLTPKPPRFVRNFMQGANSIQQALGNYRNAVIAGEFPAPEHCFD
ncbi:MAG: 3-methyl-2-oxobutanoate hydroxymethyltransferase [Spongiibacteraceae bacterium]